MARKRVIERGRPGGGAGNRAASYVRVSTLDQVQGYGLEVQQQQVAGYAAAYGLELVARFADEGVSGTREGADRPGMAAAIEAARRGEFTTLIVPAIDRLARRASVALLLWDELEAAGVVIASVKERADTSTPAGRLLRTMLMAVAEFERDSIVSRTTAGRDARARRDGERGGSLPFGYARTPAGVAVEPAAAELVRDCFRLHADGFSLRQIAARLAERGAGPRGGRWHPSSVATILSQAAAYRGGERGGSAARWPVILDGQREPGTS